MFNVFQSGWRYIRYFLTASSGVGHGIHSPFVYNFINVVLNDNGFYESYEIIENLREDLLKNEDLLKVEDLGAGSKRIGQTQRKVSDIAKTSLKPAKYGQLFFRMINHYEYKKILEVGSSLGITTSYLAKAYSEATIITLEGIPDIAAIAKKNYVSLKLDHIQLIQGNFDNTLADGIARLEKPDFVYLDGNHKYEPTMRYFEQLLPEMAENSLIIFDDIHWSEEMEAVWADVIKDSRTLLTIDLFYVGLVFFSPDFRVKQHFSIRF